MNLSIIRQFTNNNNDSIDDIIDNDIGNRTKVVLINIVFHHSNFQHEKPKFKVKSTPPQETPADNKYEQTKNKMSAVKVKSQKWVL